MVDDDKEQRIRARAHQLWLDEGQPEGRSMAHWDQAEQELSPDRAAVADASDYVMQTDEGTLNQDQDAPGAPTRRKARKPA
ncbi:DUF2934 domain-containing protein [Sphingobium nicotianae]|uniref:DUF2934 domain-containing protein n=1 Tax=Sphingobium nicotianae TaxID=2782607 RepID=A0A9X1DCQ9_9SPHN|nr:DUF2934 domain-containing protein [Sphingobium nicotianae]MBT2187552.1 DUF2934 domain-containing protein [Sphingobium nicotianae]